MAPGSSYLMNSPNKLECNIAMAGKVCYGQTLQLIGPICKKMKCCEYGTRDCIYSYLMNGPNKLECNIAMAEKACSDKCFSLLDPFESQEGNEVL